MMKKILLAVALIASGFTAAAGEDADKYLGYAWQPVRLSSYTIRGEAPEIEENLTALTALCEAEKKEGTGKYMNDIIDGLWFYAMSHAWSTPAETGGKLPSREGQAPTPTSIRTAETLINVWNAVSAKVNSRAPQVGETLAETMKRLTGKDLK